MKPVLSVLLISLLSTSLLSNESKNQVQKTEQTQTMPDEEFLKKFMKLDKEGQKIEAELKATKQLRKTAEELVKTLGVDK